MRQFLADFDDLRNRGAIQAFVIGMNFERPNSTRANGSMSYSAIWTDMTPTQAGLAAALKRVFEPEADETARKFADLLAKLR